MTSGNLNNYLSEEKTRPKHFRMHSFGSNRTLRSNRTPDLPIPLRFELGVVICPPTRAKVDESATWERVSALCSADTGAATTHQ